MKIHPKDNVFLSLFFFSSLTLPCTASHRGSFWSQWQKVSSSSAGAILEFVLCSRTDLPQKGSLGSPLSACLVFMAPEERHSPQDALHVRPDPSLPVACLFHPDTWHAAPCQNQLKHIITLLAEGFLHAVVDVSMTDFCCSTHNSVEMLHYSISAS